MSENLSDKRCARCELVYADTTENFSADSINTEILGVWCRHCARGVREQRYRRRDDWEYSPREWAPWSGPTDFPEAA
jgi:hypothetical protein